MPGIEDKKKRERERQEEEGNLTSNKEGKENGWNGGRRRKALLSQTREEKEEGRKEARKEGRREG